MENTEIAGIFRGIADVLELEGKDLYRIRAYRNAARNIEDASRQIEEIYRENPLRLEELPAIGESMAGKIAEIIETGKLAQYEKLREEVSPQQMELLKIEGLGPKKAKILMEKLGIRNVSMLEAACLENRVAQLEGMGEKTQENILKSIAHYRKSEGRLLLMDAAHYADAMMKYLRTNPNFLRVEFAGSLRRGKETIGDLDILASVQRPDEAAEYFTKHPQVARVLQKGEARSSIQLHSAQGLHVDLRIIDPSQFGSAQVYFTGSKAHNIKIRTLAKKRGLKISEYGIFPSGSDIPLAARTEEDVYRKLNMDWIPPEMREDQGEIEAAREHKLPKLVEVGDVKGDLHSHTRASDGRDSIKEMLEAAKALGYHYLAITDHTKSTRIAGGLDDRQYARHISEIRKAGEKVKGIKALCGAEVDILPDGSLDLEDETLADLDVVMASVHSMLNMDATKMTRRILKALEHPRVHILGHPTGRLIGRRKPYEADLRRIFEAARDNRVFLEINSHQDRLDLPDIHIKFAKEVGARFAVNTDAHSTSQLANLRYGIVTARRGWVEKDDVLNTRDLKALLKALTKG